MDPEGTFRNVESSSSLPVLAKRGKSLLAMALSLSLSLSLSYSLLCRHFSRISEHSVVSSGFYTSISKRSTHVNEKFGACSMYICGFGTV
jgi:hypothetical protein